MAAQLSASSRIILW